MLKNATNQQMRDLLVYHFLFRLNERGDFVKLKTLFFVGHAGIGKTQVVIDTCKFLTKLLKRTDYDKAYDEYGVTLGVSRDTFVAALKNSSLKKEESVGYVKLSLSTLEVPDLNGMPFLDKEDGNTARFGRPFFFPRDGKGFIFFDEMNRSNEDLRQALLDALEDRRINEHQIPPGWILVAAGNPFIETDGVSYETKEFDISLHSRVARVDVSFDLGEFKKYLFDTWGNNDPMTNFIDLHGEDIISPHLFGQPLPPSTSLEEVIDPRKIDYCIRAYQAFGKTDGELMQARKYSEMPFMVVASYLGEDVAHSFFEYLSQNIRISADEILNEYHKGASFKVAQLKERNNTPALQKLVASVSGRLAADFPRKDRINDGQLNNFVDFFRDISAELRATFMADFGKLVEPSVVGDFTSRCFEIDEKLFAHSIRQVVEACGVTVD